MRFVFVSLMTAIVSYFALFLMPWWIPMLISFLLILLIPMNNWPSFLSTALGGGACFLFVGLWKDFNNGYLLSSKIAELLNLPFSFLLVIISGLIGFITAGLGGWTAATVFAFFRKNDTEEITVEE